MIHTSFCQSHTTACSTIFDLLTHGLPENAKGQWTPLPSCTLHWAQDFYFILYSHCEVHTWALRSFNPDKRSIFALEEDEYCTAYSQQQQTKDDQANNQQTSISKTDEIGVPADGDGEKQVQPFFTAIGQPAEIITIDGDQPSFASGRRQPAESGTDGDVVRQAESSLTTGKQPSKDM